VAGDRYVSEVPEPDILEHAIPVAIGKVVRWALVHPRDLDARRPVPDPDEPIRFIKRQRLQQDAIHDAENRGVGGDRKCQGQPGNDREAWAAAQRAHRPPDVCPQAFSHYARPPSCNTV
jgi:hypothetical protein